MPSPASSSTLAIKDGKSKKTLAPIEKSRKKEERQQFNRFLSIHNVMVTTMNTEYERYQKVHAEEVADLKKEYNAYLDLMRSCAMSHLGGTKTAPRYLKYLEEVGEAFGRHRKANPRKARDKHIRPFKRMPTYEDEDEVEEDADAVRGTPEEGQGGEEEPASTTSSAESEEVSDEALQEPVCLPAKKEPTRLHLTPVPARLPPKTEQARLPPKKNQVRAAPKTDQVRAAPKTDQVRAAPKLTLTLNRK